LGNPNPKPLSFEGIIAKFRKFSYYYK
jgi:hypothetical protein